MKISFLSFILLFFTILVNGQKQGNMWYFGTNCGLDFSSGNPVLLSNGQTSSDIPVWESQEGTSCISDSSGNILFYTGGKTIWNKLHTPMPNGNGILGGTSSTQSSLIIPQPGNDSIFYVFTTDEFQNLGANGYRYSIVNMCLDGGNGDVVAGQKNIFLCGPSTEKLAACEDANGTGYWITGHTMYSNEFYSWHLTSAGIVDTVVSQIGTLHGWHTPTSSWLNGAAQGEMKFNPAGTKLALAISNFEPAYLDLFDFDNNTGLLSNFCHFVIDSSLYKRIWGVEFSPDGSKLYATLSGGSGGKRIYQYDMTAGGGSCSAIFASSYQLYQSNDNSVMFGMKLAPNDKIYLVGNSYFDLSSIEFPNLLGASAGFNLSAITLNGQNNFELPCMIAGYKYSNNAVKCEKLSPASITHYLTYDINVSPNPFSNQTVLKLDDYLQNATLELFNSLGQKVKNINSLYGNSITLHRDNLPTGLYFYRLIQGEKMLKLDKLLISD